MTAQDYKYSHEQWDVPEFVTAAFRPIIASEAAQSTSPRAVLWIASLRLQ